MLSPRIGIQDNPWSSAFVTERPVFFLTPAAAPRSLAITPLVPAATNSYFFDLALLLSAMRTAAGSKRNSLSMRNAGILPALAALTIVRGSQSRASANSLVPTNFRPGSCAQLLLPIGSAANPITSAVASLGPEGGRNRRRLFHYVGLMPPTRDTIGIDGTLLPERWFVGIPEKWLT